ncbi:ST14 transmembrane serine protease matriptase a [Betta splendens]|uniref:Suppressor of tumorigenicity 14 protein homolog n=1 Tax=Betta splendens TaxID=158456 RepID=A0A6P7P4Q6_BETSP|nr:ST14 transmembrane serine protease matriptase a [Betta splendens]
MDAMDTGLKYTPGRTDKDWDTSVQFLPASDNKKLEKKRGPGKVGLIVIVVAVAALVALVTGLLLWHFRLRKDLQQKRMYSGSMRITNQNFVDAYEDPNSPEFKALAEQVTEQLRTLYAKDTLLDKHHVGSEVQAFSEGSVIAYYLSEFKVPADQVAALDRSMSSIPSLAAKSGKIALGGLFVDNVTTAAVDARMLSYSLNDVNKFSEHAKPNQIGQIMSPGFPDRPYPNNAFFQWQLRADPQHFIELQFDTLNLEGNCSNDFIKIYDSLVPIETRAMQVFCGFHAHSQPLRLQSSRNVMLVTMATNKKKNFPGFKARYSQIQRGSRAQTCGGKVTGVSGLISSPNYPSFYPLKTTCLWSIEVPEGKAVKVTFKKFLLSEPGQKSKDCQKDYVMINGKKFCGEQPDKAITESSSTTNKMDVEFYSDSSYVDRGFEAAFEAIDMSDPCPRKFQCSNLLCVKSELRCDGWNDCGDMSDEIGCVCGQNDINCTNGLCKPMFWRCDGVNDCGDNTDELNCACKMGQLTCKNGKCVSEKSHCDGRDDCGDGSDELDCPRASGGITCTELTYKCKNNICISKVNPECDGQRDCDDGSDEENCDCGRNRFKSSRIVGGQNAEEGEFPWQVSLQVKPYGHVCGASIISPTWLVTAAHCVQDDSKIRFSQPGTWEAQLGLHTQRNIASTVVKRTLKQIIPHPYYNTFTFDNDMALMELDSPVSFSDYIRPICLPAATHNFPAGDTVSISGWGATREGGSAAMVLQKAEVRIINSTVCNSLMAGQITSRMLCAGVLKGGVDACQGDSGGPLSSSVGQHAFLAGVVSWGDGCARRDKPGIYTQVTKFRGWIKEKTGV